MRYRLGKLALALVLLPLLAHAQAPCTPTVTSQTSVTVAWDKVPQSAGVTELAYQVNYQEDSGGWLGEPSPLLAATQLTDTVAVDHITAWRLRVQGQLPDGTIAFSDWATYGIPPPCVQVVPPTAQSVPANFRVTQQCPDVLVAWDSSDPTMQVRLQRRKASQTAWTLVTDLAGTTYLDTTLPRHTDYCFRARYVTKTAWTPVVCVTSQ